jgi:hypothetical protein
MPKVDRGRSSKYDDLVKSEIFDGQIYVLVQGTEDEVKEGKADYSCKTDSMRQTIYTKAQKLGHALSTRTTEHDGREAVAVQRTGPYVPRKDRPKKEEAQDSPKPKDKAKDKIPA